MELYVKQKRITQADIDKIHTLNGIEKIIGSFENTISLPIIVSLKELTIVGRPLNIKVDTSFPNLREIYLWKTFIGQLYCFLRYLPLLNVIGIRYFSSKDATWIDLFEMNAVREKLPEARKVTIYVAENVYLETKMNAKNLYVKHNLIEIKRSYSDKKVVANLSMCKKSFSYLDI